MVKVFKKEGEAQNALLFRFSKKIKQSGVLKESKRRRFKERPQNKRKRALSAQHRDSKKTEMDRMRRLGIS